MEIFSVDFARGQRGHHPDHWVCQIWFAAPTVDQSADETHQGDGGSTWWPLAFWRAWREARQVYARLVANPGERAAPGRVIIRSTGD